MILRTHKDIEGNTYHILQLDDAELRLLRFDMSMALAFSQYDRYETFDDLLSLTEPQE